jgi:hypothetical protein
MAWGLSVLLQGLAVVPSVGYILSVIIFGVVPYGLAFWLIATGPIFPPSPMRGRP